MSAGSLWRLNATFFLGGDVLEDIQPEKDRQMDMQGCVWGRWWQLSTVSPSPGVPDPSSGLRLHKAWEGGRSEPPPPPPPPPPREEGLFESGAPPGSTSLPGLLPKPSLQALPSSLVPLRTSVTIRCQGPPDVDLYRLEKLRSNIYQDHPVLFISAMEERLAGCYRCSYQNGSVWSPPSDRLELVATGVYLNKPSLSAQPSPAVSPGGEVTLQCRSQFSFDQFALYKEGDAGPQKGSEKQYWADFPITAVTTAHSGTYRCYSFSSKLPYLWSAPSDPLELVVTGTSVTPAWLPTEPPSSVTEFPEASRKRSISLVNKSSTIKSSKTIIISAKRPESPTESSRTIIISAKRPESPTESSRTITISAKRPESPTGLAQQHYTKGNLVRICIGIVILILLVGILAEDWHSRKKPLPHRARPIRRPLPPLPQTQRQHSRQDGGRPDGYNHGRHN
ncbi:platelet glycoprotein VI [Meles meles]|uniref:platelet glycoprotein VI n=1 Tax=Meles meles TaxID=9662 RepID=UPI001E69FF29|nr:platelet glycoprotein VI [Meles meles]